MTVADRVLALADQGWQFPAIAATLDLTAASVEGILGGQSPPVLIEYEWLAGIENVGGGYTPAQLDADNRYLYIAPYSGHGIGRVELNGTGLDPLWAAYAEGGTGEGVAVVGGEVYFTEYKNTLGSAISRKNAEGVLQTAYIQLGESPPDSFAYSLAALGDTVLLVAYEPEEGHKHIARITGLGEANNVATLLDTGYDELPFSGITGGLCRDPDHEMLYWPSKRSEGQFFIARADTEGEHFEPEFLPIGATEDHGLQVHDGYLYWTHAGASHGSVGRYKLDGSQPAEPDWLPDPGVGAGGGAGMVFRNGYLYWARKVESKSFIGRAVLSRER